MAGRKRIHRRSIDEPGAVHHLTFSCFRRQPLLSGELAPRWFLDAVDRARARTPFELWAFVIMPEHVHLLLRPSDGTTMAAVLAQVKRPVTRKAQHWVQRHKPEFFDRMADRQPSGKVTYRFWLRGGGYDRNLRSTDDVHEKIAYIHVILAGSSGMWRIASSLRMCPQRPSPGDRRAVWRVKVAVVYLLLTRWKFKTSGWGPNATGLLTGRGLLTRESESSRRDFWAPRGNVYVSFRTPENGSRNFRAPG